VHFLRFVMRHSPACAACAGSLSHIYLLDLALYYHSGAERQSPTPLLVDGVKYLTEDPQI
jgi:hypothetical protein